LHRIRARAGAYYWAALFQQRPTVKGGGKFKREWFRVVEPSELPRRFLAVWRWWDFGATEGGGDYTAGVKMALAHDGTRYVLDVVAFQHSPGARDRRIVAVARADGRAVTQGGEQEPGAAGVKAAEDFKRMLVRAGLVAVTAPSTGDKLLRMDPLASGAENGLVVLVRAAWTDGVLAHLEGIEAGGANDDIADAMAGAYNQLAALDPGDTSDDYATVQAK
jgi:predicted phage terminase large subunit-like protein